MGTKKYNLLDKLGYYLFKNYPNGRWVNTEFLEVLRNVVITVDQPSYKLVYLRYQSKTDKHGCQIEEIIFKNYDTRIYYFDRSSMHRAIKNDKSDKGVSLYSCFAIRREFIRENEIVPDLSDENCLYHGYYDGENIEKIKKTEKCRPAFYTLLNTDEQKLLHLDESGDEAKKHSSIMCLTKR